MLTRHEFDQACNAFIRKHGSDLHHSPATSGLKGWSWNEHASFPCLGYMSRTTVHSRRLARDGVVLDPSLEVMPDEQVDDVDDAALDLNPTQHEVLTARQYVVYSPTFGVPAFYFTVHGSNGSPLHLIDLVNTSLFRPFSLDGTEATSFALSYPTASFPLLAQGDHPTLGTPCWYFHPCETASSVGEIMKEVQHDSEDQILVRWIEAWFMIVGSVVNLDSAK